MDFLLLDGTPGPSWKDLRGRVVVVDFWATWCEPCVASIPHTNALQEQFKNQPVTFLSVTYEPKNKVHMFLAKHPMETLVAIDNDMATFKSFVAWGIPIAYVFDGKGKVIAAVSPRDLTADVIRDVLDGRKPHVTEHTGWPDPKGAEKYFRQQLDEDRKQFTDHF